MNVQLVERLCSQTGQKGPRCEASTVSSPRPELGTKAAERRARSRSFGFAQDRLSGGVHKRYVGARRPSAAIATPAIGKLWQMGLFQRAGTGFTLVELLVSMFLTLFVMGTIYSVFRVQARTVKSQESRLEAQEYARAVLDLMVREIRSAGYTVSGTACAGIATATAQTLQIRLDSDDDGDCGGPNEDFAYAYDNVNQNITRAVDGGGAQDLTDGNATALQFTYYAQDSTTAMSSIVAADIQRVQVSLTVQSESPDTEFGGGVLNAAMDSNVELRNRGLSP